DAGHADDERGKREAAPRGAHARREPENGEVEGDDAPVGEAPLRDQHLVAVAVDRLPPGCVEGLQQGGEGRDSCDCEYEDEERDGDEEEPEAAVAEGEPDG